MEQRARRLHEREDIRLAPPPRVIEQTIGQMVRYHRLRMGWSQRELAVRAGTGQSSIHFLESGRDGTGEPFLGVKRFKGTRLVDKVCDALGIDEGEKRAAISYSIYIGYFARRASDQGKVFFLSPR